MRQGWCALLVLVLGAPLVVHAQNGPDFGEPLVGLTDEQLDFFADGLEDFLEIETVEDGLGPVFNEASCGTCHTDPAIGGGSTRLETRFGKIANGAFDPLPNRGGSLLQDHGIGALKNPPPGCENTRFPAEIVPAAATIVAMRRTTPLFGLGLVNAVPDSAFRDLAAKQKKKTPDTAGVVSEVDNLTTHKKAVGKFGWKAQNPTIFQFAGDAYVNEMGITNPQFNNENCPRGNCDALVCDPVPGEPDHPEDDGSGVTNFTNFMNLLAPPPRGPIDNEVQQGEKKFNKIGCGDCHVDTLTTGPNAVKPLDRVAFHPFSDFLLHDMGALGDGIQQNNATGKLMRTAPLWGLREVKRFLHDGRAQTLVQAIDAHAGQGKAARDAFFGLPARQQEKVLTFLDSL